MNRVRSCMYDRVLKGVGRIHRSLETANKSEAARRERMIFALSDQNRLDILRGIQSGRLSISQVYEAHRLNRLDGLPTAEALTPLKDSVESWLDEGFGSKKPLRPATLAGYRQMWRQAIDSGAFGSNPTVADVTAESVERYRRTLNKSGHAPMANRFWAAARSFLRSKLGNRHPQVHALEDLRRYPEIKKVRHALTAAGFWAWTAASPESIRDAMIALAITGMMPSELERLTPDNFDRANDWVLVPGAKTEGRPRIVGVPPWAWEYLERVTPWRLDRSRFQKLVKKAAKAGGVPWATLYDLRRAFARWHEASRTPRSRIVAYMGHGGSTMTDEYLRSEVEPYARDDARRMGEFLQGARQSNELRLVS